MEEENQIVLKGSLEISIPKKGKSRRYVLQGVKSIGLKERKNKLFIRFKTDDNIIISIPLQIKPIFVKVKHIINKRNEMLFDDIQKTQDNMTTPR